MNIENRLLQRRNARHQSSPTGLAVIIGVVMAGAIGGLSSVAHATAAPRIASDHDGDGKSDITVWDPVSGYWGVITSSNSQVAWTQWGAPGDIPVPGDYDGDGKADFAIWRPSTGLWWVIETTGPGFVAEWGVSGDIPVPGDYDGDGKTDMAIWRPSTGEWWVWQTATNVPLVRQWGWSTDIPVPGDYDGDAKTDYAIWRPSTGQWWVLMETGASVVQQWGVSTDIPITADYNGDGKTDFTVWRPTTGEWWVAGSTTRILGGPSSSFVPLGSAVFARGLLSTTPDVPATPTGLTCKVIAGATSSTAQLTWTSVSSATYYTLFTLAGTIPNQAVYGTSTTVNLKSSSTSYSLDVAACNSGGCSAHSAVCVANTPPPTPTGLRAVYVNEGTDNAITTSWDAVSGFQYLSYVLIETKPDGSTSRQDLTTTSYKWTWLQRNATYLYSVSACDDLGGCSPPAYASGTTGPSAPTSGLINIDLQMSYSDPVACANSSSGFWVDGSSVGQASGSVSSSGSGLTCDIKKLASPLALKNHWVCAQWAAYCCKCQTLTSTNYAPTTTLVGSDCGFSSPAVPNGCK